MMSFETPSEEQLTKETAARIFQQQQQLRCLYCIDSLLIEDYQAGDLVCSGCGLVIGDRIVDVGAEWRTFTNDSGNKSRVGTEESVLYDGMDLSTMIGHLGSTSVAYDENGERKYRNKKYLNSSQRTLVCGFKEIAEMAEKLNATRPVIESGQLIFKKIQTKQALKGRSNEAIAAACLYVAYRKDNAPRTFKEICAVSKASKRNIAKCYKVIAKEIGETIKHASIVDYIPRFVAHLAMNSKTENMAREYAQRIDQTGALLGRSPTTIAALAILMAIERENIAAGNAPLMLSNAIGGSDKDDNTTSNMVKGASGSNSIKKIMKEISVVTGAAESTIRDAYQLVKQHSISDFSELFGDPSLLQSQQHQPPLETTTILNTSTDLK